MLRLPYPEVAIDARSRRWLFEDLSVVVRSGRVTQGETRCGSARLNPVAKLTNTAKSSEGSTGFGTCMLKPETSALVRSSVRA